MNDSRRNPGRSIALAAAALVALPAAGLSQQGQQHRHSGQMEGRHMSGMMMEMHARRGMTGMMGGMGAMAATSPRMLLAQREALDLTGEQVDRLETLQERMAGVRSEHMASMQAARQELAALADEPDLNLDAYESTLQSLADERVAMHVAMARIGQEARDVLTPEQREKLLVGMEFMREMMKERMQEAGSGMRSGDMRPMMRHRMMDPDGSDDG